MAAFVRSVGRGVRRRDVEFFWPGFFWRSARGARWHKIHGKSARSAGVSLTRLITAGNRCVLARRPAPARPKPLVRNRTNPRERREA